MVSHVRTRWIMSWRSVLFGVCMGSLQRRAMALMFVLGVVVGFAVTLGLVGVSRLCPAVALPLVPIVYGFIVLGHETAHYTAARLIGIPVRAVVVSYRGAYMMSTRQQLGLPSCAVYLAGPSWDAFVVVILVFVAGSWVPPLFGLMALGVLWSNLVGSSGCDGNRVIQLIRYRLHHKISPF